MHNARQIITLWIGNWDAYGAKMAIVSVAISIYID